MKNWSWRAFVVLGAAVQLYSLAVPALLFEAGGDVEERTMFTLWPQIGVLFIVCALLALRYAAKNQSNGVWLVAAIPLGFCVITFFETTVEGVSLMFGVVPTVAGPVLQLYGASRDTAPARQPAASEPPTSVAWRSASSIPIGRQGTLVLEEGKLSFVRSGSSAIAIPTGGVTAVTSSRPGAGANLKICSGDQSHTFAFTQNRFAPSLIAERWGCALAAWGLGGLGRIGFGRLADAADSAQGNPRNVQGGSPPRDCGLRADR